MTAVRSELCAEGCALGEWLQTFRRIVLPPSSVLSRPTRTIIRNVGNHSSNGTALLLEN